MAFSRLLTSRRLLSTLLHTPTPTPAARVTGAATATTPFAHNFPPARFFSATRRAGPGAPRQRAADIGARARQLQSRRLWTYALAFGCAAGFVVTVLATFQDQLVFYLTPTDALARFATDPSKTRCRLGGLVLEGSVAHPSSSSEIEFVVTDLITDVLVRYEGALPDLFREGHSVVVEGFLKPLTDDLRRDGAGRKVSDKAREGQCFLQGTEVLAKHDEKYMPKEVGEAIERNKKQIEADAAAAAAAAEETAVVAADGAKASS
ncbi:hypothetical protein ACQ4PT_017292 [Festuca glaucescens]